MSFFLNYKKNNFFIKTFFVLAGFWFVLFLFIYISYLNSISQKKISKKGGTFVEGIFGPTSFLPYLRNDLQSKFYQSFLFSACLNPQIDKQGNVDFEDNMCHVTTPDYQTYYITLNSGFIWSDGIPVSLEDVFFTYNDIVVGNKRDLKKLKKYSDIKISYTNDGRIKIVFPQANIDNNLFFTNFILPKHAIEKYSLMQYQREFSLEPVYTKCSKIETQTVDQYSLVFDLSNCDDTNLGYYQIKNLISFQTFKESTSVAKSIVDIYEGYETLTGYKKLLVDTRKDLIMFFNTKSNKLRVRTRRSLAGFVHESLKNMELNQIKKYQNKLFDQFLSKGENIKDFLTNEINIEGLSEKDLKDSGIKQLEETIKITGENQKLVFFTKNSNQTITLSFKSSYKKIGIKDNDNSEYYPKSFSNKSKTAKYKIGVSYGNLKQGRNKFEVFGYTDKGKKLLATINIYYLKPNSTNNKLNEKITIIYYDIPQIQEFISQLQKSMTDKGILKFFQFEKKNFEDFFDTIKDGNYDIAIGIVDMKLNQSIVSIFDTDEKTVNISQYSNPTFLHYLKNYYSALSSQKENYLQKLNGIYAKDMPLLMIGTIKESLNINQTIYEEVKNIKGIYIENRREKIYKNLALMHSTNLNINEIFNLKNFRKFILQKI